MIKHNWNKKTVPDVKSDRVKITRTTSESDRYTHRTQVIYIDGIVVHRTSICIDDDWSSYNREPELPSASTQWQIFFNSLPG